MSPTFDCEVVAASVEVPASGGRIELMFVPGRGSEDELGAMSLVIAVGRGLSP